LERDELPGTNPNTLPYFISETQTGLRILVRFAPLTAADEAELRGMDWSQAVFRDIWPELVNDSNTFKMLCVNSHDTRIQGMVRLGQYAPVSGLLKKSLLEAAPFNRYGRSTQSYHGVGRVLVARLVIESVWQGGQGRVVVTPRPGSEVFYHTLGFRRSPKMILDSEDSIRALMTSVLLPSLSSMSEENIP
jgi:hypothetical protein